MPDTKQATESIDDIMAAVAQDICAKGIAKDGLNREQNFRYRSLDSVLNVAGPIMAKHGVTMTIEVVSRDTSESRATKSGGSLKFVVLDCIFRFRWRDQERMARTIGEAMDSGDKATNKAMAFATKYALLTTFSIPVVGADEGDAYGVQTYDMDDTVRNEAIPESEVERFKLLIARADTYHALKTIVADGLEIADRYKPNGAHERIRTAANNRLKELKSTGDQNQSHEVTQ